MSVLMVDLEVYEAVACKMHQASINNDPQLFPCYKLTETEISFYVKTWAKLNEWTYCVAYADEYEAIGEIIEFQKLGKYPLIQFYKWLFCIDYNIDMEEIKIGGMRCKPGQYEISPSDQTAYDFLIKLKNHTAHSIVDGMPEYQDGAWGELTKEIIEGN